MSSIKIIHHIFLQEGTTKLIYAFHPDDPSSENDIPQHDPKSRGARSTYLLNSVENVPTLPDDTKTFNFTNNKVTFLDFLRQKEPIGFEIIGFNWDKYRGYLTRERNNKVYVFIFLSFLFFHYREFCRLNELYTRIACLSFQSYRRDTTLFR